MTLVSRTVKSEILLYLQASRLNCHRCTDARKARRRPGQRWRRASLTAQQAASAPSLCLPPRTGAAVANSVSLGHSWRIPCLGNPNFFIIGYKETCPNFDPQGDIILIILNKKETCPLLQQDSIRFKPVQHTNIFDKIVQNQELSGHAEELSPGSDTSGTGQQTKWKHIQFTRKVEHSFSQLLFQSRIGVWKLSICNDAYCKCDVFPYTVPPTNIFTNNEIKSKGFSSFLAPSWGGAGLRIVGR